MVREQRGVGIEDENRVACLIGLEGSQQGIALLSRVGQTLRYALNDILETQVVGES